MPPPRRPRQQPLDVAYVAWLFARTAGMAERAIRAAVAAGFEVPGWAGSAVWLYDYHARTLRRAAEPDPGPSSTHGTSTRQARPAPHGGGR